MIILDGPSHDILHVSPVSDTWLMSEAARVCYKSSPRKGHEKEDNLNLLKRLIDQEDIPTPFEHSMLSVRFVCDRGVSHELVRHRLASFNQESTRYCNYSKGKFGSEITVVKPIRIHTNSIAYDIWKTQCEQAEQAYFDLLDAGIAPENARSVLPTCVKTEIIMSTNLREWYHVFDLRTSCKAHPDMRLMMMGLLFDIQMCFPYLFEELYHERNKEFIKDFGIDFDNR